MQRHDVVIIGAGAAGLSAALVLTRARRDVVVLDSGSPRNGPAAHMHGFLSRDGMPAAELLAAGRAEVRSYGGLIVDGLVTDINADGKGGFRVAQADGRPAFSTRHVVVTTGLRDELPDIPGLRERWARDVLHCPYCHGHEVRDRRLAVLAATPDAARYAQIVRQWTDDLTYVVAPGVLTPDERTALRARRIGIVEGPVEQLVVDGEDHLRGLQLDDGCVVACDALFVPPRFVANDTLLTGLGATVAHRGWVVVDGAGRTSVPRVWAAGNVVDPRAQVITAAGAGSATAIALNADLVDDDIRTAVAAFPPHTSLTTERRTKETA
ncbi:MAG: NAD(P)/FAD-dependent oxidoreductase [Pseudonocardia sp.]|uniref:NAD(P)/FAD-dependent oxidoreductase n=1 Tax=unclassified Pseudonocardia TaxID=2619320 RepID=UPI00086907A4|nr:MULTISPECIES: NAD(P)/FAD-dependent oxidoreductase [unclassified Pseudonocardia]MBN9112412.1 NAD(P)/FAD-dependent oxidoreductase [Pseudonocardia sp.]ODU27314.1 MAG: thioredoxin reductase [Pseudonocardia sp. SCN 72-51]ODV08927.1 MAG: thioredoxin reductase [Pseudonocardia sp. SCN 73-27]